MNSAYSSSFLFGIAYGGAVCAFPLIVAKVFGTSHFGVIYGLLTIGTGMGAVLGPILGGYLFDLTRTYSNSFLTDVLVSLIGAGFLLLFRLRDTLYTSRLD